jgi:hypothetical protein
MNAKIHAAIKAEDEAIAAKKRQTEVDEALDAAELAIDEYHNGNREWAEKWLLRAVTAQAFHFNVNDNVRIRLTKHGRAIHRDNFKKLFPTGRKLISLKYSPPKEDADGWSTWQLWRLMQEFGPHMNTGFDPPFETEIEIPTP